MKRWLSALLALICLFPVSGCADAPVTAEKLPDTIELVPLTECICQVRGTWRLVDDCAYYSTDKMAERVASYNQALDAAQDRPPVYLYLAESSRSHPMTQTFPENSDAYEYLLENLHADCFDHLKYTTYAQYCQYFYTTDHHWNYRGSYQAYVDIVHMLKGDDEDVLEPVGTATFPIFFNGYYCRDTGLQFSREYFSVYLFDPFPAYTAYVGGAKRQYDHVDVYLRNRYNSGVMTNHYANYYGGDTGSITFVSGSKGKGSLLMIGNSLSNAVKTLLTNHYDTIYYVDLRHYKKLAGESFSISSYLAKYPVDQILILGDVTLFMTGEMMDP